LTGTALVTEALEELRAMTAGDTLDATDGAKGLACLNRLIDTSNIGRGSILTERAEVRTLVIGQQSYTIGVDPDGGSADFATTRPIRVTRANLLLTSGDDTVYRPIRILTREEWRRKGTRDIAGMPVEMYSDGGNPLTKWWFYMTPDQYYQVEIWSWRQSAPLDALTDKIIVPPGYYEWWLYSLAMRLAGPFGIEPMDTTVALWKRAEEAIKSLNLESPAMALDSDLDDCGAGLYNWSSGEVEID
jgi:hypothetical protein